MRHETAGDPMSGLKWTKRTTRKIAEELATLNIQVSHATVAKLLHQMGFSLRANEKTISSGVKVSASAKEERNLQFEYISVLRCTFEQQGDPVISVDTKKKEMIGHFKNNGQTWSDAPIPVNDHDFRSEASGMAVPYGIYDTQCNREKIIIGISSDTPAFAVSAIEQWWKTEGKKRYPRSNKLLILADSGSSNGVRPRAWRYYLQHVICNKHQLDITVCHYPTGTSKWNPIEHRLFSEISKNWAGKPLGNYETVLKYIRTTKTSTGLKVTAQLNKNNYPKGESISEYEMAQLALTRHDVFPKLNYSLVPDC